ncbi:hypothetical protein V9K67_01120 [Paraflavisolibacter sp. H34]|uniref:hypothetical protein n=1 Tax=Huijunlia imazamoxiresistens TaxID=3127457 RepID=UPI00301A162C
MKWKRFWEKLGNWELWPFELRYFAITPVWAWYCLRSGSVWFFSSSNPTLTFGGFEGEDKREMYDLLPESSYPKTVYIKPGAPWEEVRQAVVAHGFTFPFCVKPDVGMKGLLFRKVDKWEQLEKYHRELPVDYLVQDLVDYPVEASVFYYRFPGQEKGVITGFIRKELMEVTGDGRKSVWELILEHEKAKHRLEEMRIKHEDYLDTVLPQGQSYYLTYAANLNRGARFVNLHHLIDDQLLSVFDPISHRAQFYYGRYDLKCTSIDDLKQGKNFIILEFNGSGAEPNHVYNSGMSLLEAYREILMHWKVLYRISRINHKKGIRYWPLRKGLKFLRDAKKHLAVLEELDNRVVF